MELRIILSVAATAAAAPAVVHEALWVIARRYAAQLNDFSARTIRAVRYNEVHERRVVNENEAVCHDESVQPSTGIGAGINSGTQSRRAKKREGSDKRGTAV